jgi:hypothetical protein
VFGIVANKVFDPDLDLLAEVLGVIDGQLAVILGDWDVDAQAAEEAEAMGYFDRAEHITGLGFVAYQAYMTATYGYLRIAKPQALIVGPFHKSGQSVFEIINHAANYWKHRDEWHLDKSPGRENRIRDAFEAVGFPIDLDYPLSGILTELVAPEQPAAKPLVAKLATWRDGLRDSGDTSDSGDTIGNAAPWDSGDIIRNAAP